MTRRPKDVREGSADLVLIGVDTAKSETASDQSLAPSPHRIVVATPDHPYVYAYSVLASY